jgi:hypothetical protein
LRIQVCGRIDPAADVATYHLDGVAIGVVGV